MMQVYGFVGASGTGKSYRVTELAREQQIPLIIDDGLLIRGNTVLAGTSAKAEKTWFGSVKRALFFSPMHAAAVQRALNNSAASSVIIVGTSCNMVKKIASALHLPNPEKYFYIEDVSTKEEMETARHIRQTEGKHVIPVPTFQIRKDFSGYWLDPLQIFRHVGARTEAEKTLVRPTYSYMGDFTIANSVLITICTHEAKKMPGITRIWSCGVQPHGKSVILHLDISLSYGICIPSYTAELTKKLSSVLEDLTDIVAEEVSIFVRTLDLPAVSLQKISEKS